MPEIPTEPVLGCSKRVQMTYHNKRAKQSKFKNRLYFGRKCNKQDIQVCDSHEFKSMWCISIFPLKSRMETYLKLYLKNYSEQYSNYPGQIQFY